MAFQTIDDRDAAVVYSVHWRRAGSPSEYQGTTSFAADAGATARLTFKGTSVAVYGTTRPPNPETVPPQSSYTVDGNGSTTYTCPQDGGVEYSQLFYQSPTLSDGQHTLTVTNLHDSDEFFLDYFVVVVGDETPVIPSSSGAPSPTVTTTTIIKSTSSPQTSTIVSPVSSGATSSTVNATVPVGGIPLTATPSGNSGNVTPSSTSSNNNQDKTARIAGGIGGAIGGIILLAVIFLLYARRRQRKANLEREAQTVTSFWDIPPGPRNSAWVTRSATLSRSKSIPAINRPLSPTNSYYDRSSRYSSYDAYAQDAFVVLDRGRMLRPQQPPSSLYNQGPSRCDSSVGPPCYPSDPPSYTCVLPEKLRSEFYHAHRTYPNGTSDGDVLSPY